MHARLGNVKTLEFGGMLIWINAARSFGPRFLFIWLELKLLPSDLSTARLGCMQKILILATWKSRRFEVNKLDLEMLQIWRHAKILVLAISWKSSRFFLPTMSFQAKQILILPICKMCVHVSMSQNSKASGKLKCSKCVK